MTPITVAASGRRIEVRHIAELLANRIREVASRHSHEVYEPDLRNSLTCAKGSGLNSGAHQSNQGDHPGQVNPYNEAAVRGKNGIWNEHSLPVTTWEDPNQRVVIPTSLRQTLILPVPHVLRWDARKYDLVISQHELDLPVIRDLSRYSSEWRYHGEELGEHAGNQRILFRDDDGRWYAVSIGPLQGSVNVITVIGSQRRGVCKEPNGGDDKHRE